MRQLVLKENIMAFNQNRYQMGSRSIVLPNLEYDPNEAPSRPSSPFRPHGPAADPAPEIKPTVRSRHPDWARGMLAQVQNGLHTSKEVTNHAFPAPNTFQVVLPAHQYNLLSAPVGAPKGSGLCIGLRMEGISSPRRHDLRLRYSHGSAKAPAGST